MSEGQSGFVSMNTAEVLWYISLNSYTQKPKQLLKQVAIQVFSLLKALGKNKTDTTL